MEEQDFLYDAFISYRHLPLDKAVAVRLQELLESYRPPKELGKSRIRRVFRDQTELPTSGDLGADITGALLHSRYLIVICSPETRNSIWCMEEIRQFRAFHQGRNDHILVVLVKGEPHEVFPEELMYESYSSLQPDGSEREEYRQIEPLSADVRSGSTRQSLKILRTEFLRVAAPILGCGYDDLYRRHERRRRRRFAAAAGSGTAALTGVLAVISVFAWRTYLSEKNYQSTLADSYTRQGIESAENGDLQDALLYYASAISLEPDEQDAAVMGAAILLEQNVWPYVEKEETGWIFDGRILSGEAASAGDSAIATDTEGTLFLKHMSDGYFIVSSDGTKQSLGTETWEWIGAAEDGSCWVFCAEEDIYLYETQTGEVSALPRPDEINQECEDEAYTLDALPAALPTQDGGVIVVYGGYVYLYTRTDDDWVQAARADLSDVFPSEAGDLDIEGYLWVSGDGTLAVVASGFGVAAFDTSDLTLRATKVGGYHYLLNDVAFSGDGMYYALIYGNSFGLSYNDPGGYLEVYDRDGELCFATEEDSEMAYEGAVFDPEDSSRLLAWSNTCFQLWDVEAQSLFAVPVNDDWIEQAAFDDNGNCITVDGDGNLTTYGLISFSAVDFTGESADSVTGDGGASSDEAEEIEAEGMLQAYRTSEDMVIACSASRVFLLDEEGNTLDEIHMDAAISDMLYDPDASVVYLYRQYSTCLYMIEVSGDQTTFGDIITLNTRGGLVQSLSRMDGRIAVLTGSNQVLLYAYGEAEPEMVIRLEHGGVVQEMQEITGGYMAVYIQTNQSEDDSYHLDTEEIVELWDLNDGIHIADLDPDEAYLAWQQLPTPDDETIAFLLALSGSTFDSSQNIVADSPTYQSDTLGAWTGSVLVIQVQDGQTQETEISDAAETEESQETGESPDIVQEDLDQLLVGYQDGPAEGEESIWFSACDEIWVQLYNGEIEYTADSLDDWFSLYMDEADAHGYLSQIQTGVTCYLSINVEGILLEDMAYSEFDHNLMLLMARTELYDETIAEGFGAAADTLKAAIMEQEIQDAMMELSYTYEMWWFRCCQDLLQGMGEDSFADFDVQAESAVTELLEEIWGDTRLYTAGDFSTLAQMFLEELYVAEMLVKGESAEAAELTSNCMQLMADQGTSADDILYYQQISQTHYYVLALRDILPQGCLNQYLELLPVDSGIRVSGLSTEAQQLGLMLNDLIVAADDEYISCFQQAQDLLNGQSDITLRIVRDGQVIYIEKSAPAEYTGYFDTTFRETISD